MEIEERGVKLRLTVVDTPGYGDAINSQDWYVDGPLKEEGSGNKCPVSLDDSASTFISNSPFPLLLPPHSPRPERLGACLECVCVKASSSLASSLNVLQDLARKVPPP